MKDLGLERRSKEVTLKDYLSDKYGDDEKKGKKKRTQRAGRQARFR